LTADIEQSKTGQVFLGKTYRMHEAYNKTGSYLFPTIVHNDTLEKPRKGLFTILEKTQLLDLSYRNQIMAELSNKIQIK